MKAILSATALAGALALTPLAALAQQQPGQPSAPETEAAPMPQTQPAPAPEAQPSQPPETQATEAPDAARDFKVIMSAEDLEGFDAAEVRVESVEDVPRDQVQAINNALDPANPDAQALRERLSELEGFEQALSEENVEEERVVGAAIEGEELVVYILPEGQTREQWGAQMPAPSGEAQPGGADSKAPGATGATGTDQQSGGAGATGSGQQPSSGGSNY
jgi:hypothetical protein